MCRYEILATQSGETLSVAYSCLKANVIPRTFNKFTYVHGLMFPV